MDDQYTFENKTYRDTYRHTTSHILAQAMKRLYPEVKLAIGPAIEDGFYYDFDSPQPFTPEVLEKLEAEMRKICKEKLRLERFELPRAEALKFMEERDEPYKVELINDLPEDAVISFYRQGEFVDLCAGPHLDSTGRVKGNAIKLTSVTGAYWRGDSSRKMLQRIYGTCFPKKEELDAYLARIEEAKKRDHRKLGKELGLFTFMDEGPGFPFFLPNGMVLKNQLIDYWREIHKKAGYVEISTPIMLNQDLWHRSGHWDHYKDNMYTTVIDDVPFALKPMNCPGGMLVYKSQPHSYRDLPLRVGELGIVHRHELSGALHGLFRVRCFTQDDAHIFMTPDQVKDEIKGVAKLIDDVYSLFGFKYHSYRDLPLRVGELGIVHRHELSGALHGLFRVRCFTQDDAHIFMTPDQVKDEIKGVAKLIDDVYSLFGFKYHMELSTMPEDHIGTDEQWEAATNGLVSALNELGKPYVINEGDGAFYGPKIDFHLEDSLGRTWQCGTIQLDMQMPERFDLEYVGADGEKHRPVMIHRVCFGSIERFIGILTEHYAGAFPLWLAPVQVKVMPITDRTNNYAKHVADRLEKAGLRVETDLRNEKIGYKIREAQSQKIPYMLVLGDKEAENDTISVRTLSGEQSVEGLSDFIARLQADVKSRKS